MRDKEYIERGALISILDAKSEMAMGTPKAVFASVSKMVELLPAADVVEVRHGKWTLIGYGNGRPLRWKCSACGYETFDAVNGDTNFCPNCGAKMDGGKERL